ncbi:MAG TPA: hypothetical protein DIU15_12945 [Deltaproteobacteria bacterium]|nr:hypothetical protein [Deltaproteobacteria bacterium]HCP46946.1 hypothetical protein [Deltaproteobacteria bacterium]
MLLGLSLWLVGGSPETPRSLLYFTTASSGTESVLFRAPLAGAKDSALPDVLDREPLWSSQHAAGFQPRGTLSERGTAAWVTLPAGRGVGDPAWLHVSDTSFAGISPLLIDREALYLQRLVFDGERLLYLRGQPSGDTPSPGATQVEWVFSLLSWEPGDSEPQEIYRSQCLWVMLVGLVPPASGTSQSLAPAHPILLEIHPTEPRLLELDPSGAVIQTWTPGRGLLVRDLAIDPGAGRSVVFLATAPGPDASSLLRLDLDTGTVDEVLGGLAPHASPRMLPGGQGVVVAGPEPGGDGLRFPEHVLSDGSVIYRAQGSAGLSWLYSDTTDLELRLVPEGDPAQDVSFLGVLQ